MDSLNEFWQNFEENEETEDNEENEEKNVKSTKSTNVQKKWTSSLDAALRSSFPLFSQNF